MTVNFEVTSNMSSIGIKDFILNGSDFVITFTNDKKCCVQFSSKKGSISEQSKAIGKKLWFELDKSMVNEKAFQCAIQDIENQLIQHRDEIFRVSANTVEHTNPVHKLASTALKIKEQIKATRQQIRESNTSADEWRLKLIQNYDRLRNLTEELIPEIWLPMEFAISIKAILNIKDWNLPFMAVLLAPPSSSKTVVIDMLKDYPSTFTTDEFTPGAFVSHNSGLSEEQLQAIDMLPKMENKFCTFPELAPLFTAKDEDLQRNFGKILRILDGNGFQSDSGAQGHRGYSREIMFVILGAAVEIQYRIYKLFGNLGQKIYYLRLPRIEKSKYELKESAKQKNNFKEKVSKIKSALFDYLVWFDAAPESVAEIDSKSGLVKFAWDIKKEDESEQDAIIGYIANLGQLLAHLRGIVGTFESRSFKQQNISNYTNDSKTQKYSELSSIDLDFENDIPIIEHPSRAIIHLKSLAMGHAISRGRSYFTFEDLSMVIKVALSTAPIARVRIFDLLLEHNGELTTGDIVNELHVSPHTALRTMTELCALEIVDKEWIVSYTNSGFKITLKDKFKWFITPEFEKLREGFRPADYNKLQYRMKAIESSAEANIEKREVQQDEAVCDKESHDSHMLATFSPPLSHADQKFKSENNTSEFPSDCCDRFPSRSTRLNNNLDDDGNQQTTVFYKDQENSLSSYSGSKICKNVTMSHANIATSSTSMITTDAKEKPVPNDDNEEDLIFQEINKIIKDASGSQIAFNFAVEKAYNRSSQVRDYLKNQKLTSRENRKVRNLSIKTIRHENIEVVKHKPQLVVRWVKDQSKQEQSKAELQSNGNSAADYKENDKGVDGVQ